jgi:hypothetical protein
MISVSSWFETWMTRQTLNLLRKFTYDDIHETERVQDFGSINRGSDAIVSGGTSLVLINTDKYWNKFIDDKSNLRRTAKLQLGMAASITTIARSGIARSAITASGVVTLKPGSTTESLVHVPRGGEWLDILTSWADDPEFSEALVNLSLRDKSAGLLEKELGSDEAPLNYYSSAYNPADLAWDILTVHGGLDSTASIANSDIDYSSWSAWKSDCTTANLSLRARFTGQTIREALELIRGLTNSDIYAAGNGKIKFFRFTQGTPPSETYLFNTDNFREFSVKLDNEKIINYLKVYYGYDPTTESWTGNYLLEDSVSQSTYGKSSETIENTTVWHDTLASATSYANRRIQVYKNPLEVISLTSFMMGTITEVGDIVRITNSFFGYSGDPYFRVFKITNLDLAAGTISFEIANFQDVSDYSYTTPLVHDKSSEGSISPIENTSQDWSGGLGLENYYRMAQRITLTGDTLQQVSWYVAKNNGPTGTMYARIRKVSDDSIIETSSKTVDVGTMQSSAHWEDFPFTCAPNEEVYISLEYSDGGDGNNFVRVYCLSGDVISGEFYTYISSWVDAGTLDMTIKIQFAGYPATNTVDDNTSTFWIPDPADEAGAWISWDMGSVKYSKGCRIYWGSEAIYRPSEYKLWVSTNGTDWTEVIHETSAPSGGAWKTYEWSAQQIRYFKLSIITHGASGTKVYETDEYSIS